jgi:hypothetical protein
MIAGRPRVHFATRVLQVGITALAIGALIYFAARSSSGGLAGILLTGLISWFAFECAMSVVRVFWRVRARINPQHASLGSCFGTIAVCGAGGLVLLFGYQLILGVLLGALAAFLTHRTALPTLSQLAGLDPIPERPGSGAPFLSRFQSRRTAAALGLVGILAGVLLAGLGTVRVLEGYSVATDYLCTHPCGMVGGLWVQVMPDSRRAVVTRLDPLAVQLRVRFREDVPGDKSVSRSDFALVTPPVTYPHLTDRQGCDPWPSKIFHIDDTTGDLALCFAIPLSDSVDFAKLVLEWTHGGARINISLGKPNVTGTTNIGDNPSPAIST